MDEIKTKICTKCGGEFPTTLEFFHKAKKGKHGLSCRCKTCRREYSKEYQRKRYKVDSVNMLARTRERSKRKKRVRNKPDGYYKTYYRANRKRRIESKKKNYIKNIIKNFVKDSPLMPNEIPEELIRARKLLVLIRSEIMKQQRRNKCQKLKKP